jgi:protein-L-isoaspartate(D-aspartate) O-methyltransferase
MTVNAQTLVDTLKKSGRLKNSLYEHAFLSVPRHVFLPEVPLEVAYADEAVPIKVDSSGYTVSSSSQPSMMLLMFEQMGLDAGMNVLEVGTGTGYNAAIISTIVGSRGRVTTLELDADIARHAEQNLHRAGFGHVVVVATDGAQGYAPRATYDRILCTASVWDVPEAWIRQLKPGGRIVTPLQLDGIQVSAAFKLGQDGYLVTDSLLPTRFVYLRGALGVPPMTRRVGSTDLRLIGEGTNHIDTVKLHMILSDDQDRCQLSQPISDDDFWTRFMPFVLLNRPADANVCVFHIDENQKAYGIPGGYGLAIVMPGSAAFAPYGDKGNVFCFGGSDAFLVIDNLLQAWLAAGLPGLRDCEIKVLPHDVTVDEPQAGRLLKRPEHQLWIKMTAQPRDDA